MIKLRSWSWWQYIAKPSNLTFIQSSTDSIQFLIDCILHKNPKFDLRTIIRTVHNNIRLYDFQLARKLAPEDADRIYENLYLGREHILRVS